MTGANAARDISRLVATLLVLFRVLQWTQSTFGKTKLFQVLQGITPKSILDTFENQFQKAVRLPTRLFLVAAAKYCRVIDEKRPLVCATLQLGKSWDEFICLILSEEGHLI